MCFYLVLTWLWQKEKSLKRRFSLNYTTPSGSVVKNSPAIQETGDMGLIPGKIPWRRAWQPTSVFLPGKSHGQRSLAGCSPWGRKESNTAEATEHARVVHRRVHTRACARTHTHTHTRPHRKSHLYQQQLTVTPHNPQGAHILTGLCFHRSPSQAPSFAFRQLFRHKYPNLLVMPASLLGLG